MTYQTNTANRRHSRHISTRLSSRPLSGPVMGPVREGLTSTSYKCLASFRMTSDGLKILDLSIGLFERLSVRGELFSTGWDHFSFVMTFVGPTSCFSSLSPVSVRFHLDSFVFHGLSDLMLVTVSYYYFPREI